MLARARLLLWPAGAAVGILAERSAYGAADAAHWVPDLAAGWSMIAGGLVASSHRDAGRGGMLLTATGFAWFAGNFTNADVDSIAWLSAHALFLYRGPLVHLVLTFPCGRARSAVERVAAAAGYAAAAVTPVWASQRATIVLAAALVAVAAAGHRRAVGRERRERAAALAASAFVAVLFATVAAARLAAPTVRTADATLLATQVALTALAVGLTAALVARPWARARVADLVVDLGEGATGGLRSELARALGDPTLQVGYPRGDDDGFVDEGGRPIELPQPGDGRSVARVERDGSTAAILVHDPAVLDDPALVDAIAVASRLAGAHARLQTEVLAQLAELQESRRRLVDAGDEERRQLERRLRDGAEAVLLRLEPRLGEARARAGTDAPLGEALAGVEEEFRRTLSELRELGRGLHPQALAEHGLAQALASLAATSAVPVELHVASAWLPQEVEAAVYFLCAEALANAAKHAGASTVTIAVETDAGGTRVVVADDGAGGADPARGGGLRGLADRVEALGGGLSVESNGGTGTRVVAELPP